MRHEQLRAAVVMGFPHLVSRLGAAKARKVHDHLHDEHESVLGVVHQNNAVPGYGPRWTIVRLHLAERRPRGIGSLAHGTPHRTRFEAVAAKRGSMRSNCILLSFS